MLGDVIARVISGGQSGVDEAALAAALARGVPTGGTAAKGWATTAGPRPDLAVRYGLVECRKSGYAARTRENVAAADFTLRIAANWRSHGEVRTAVEIVRARRPSEDVTVRRRVPGGGSGWGYVFDRVEVDEAVAKIRACAVALGRPIVLNVAGNSDRTARDIGAVAAAIMERVLDGCAS